MKKCPFCAEEIQAEAIKCRFCGEFLVKPPTTKWYFKTSFLVIAFLCIGPFALPFVWLHPKLSNPYKIIISVVVIVVSVVIAMAFISSLRAISNYYKQMFAY